MNIKTTVILFVLVVALAAAIVVLKEKAPPPAPTIPTSTTPAATIENDKLLDEAFGEAFAITVNQPNQPDWRFAKADEGAMWEMVDPSAGPAQKWQVDQISRQLTGLTYSVKYDPTDGTVTAASAGLEPPRAVVTLTNEKGEQVGVEIGRHEGERETFVRVAGEDSIYRVKPSLKNLLKKNALEYRDQQLFKVTAPGIVKIGIDAADGEPCELVKTGGQWRFTKPAPARAMAQVISELCSSFAGLRATAWVEDNVEDPNLYGLGDDALTVTITAEETPPAPIADGDTNGGTEIPAPVISTYMVRFSTLHPLDDESKVYLRRGDEALVGTVLKTVADKFRPDLKTWRDNRMIEQDPTLARRLRLDVGGATAEFVRAATSWTYADTDAPADRTEIEKTLNAIGSMRALNFVPGADADPASFGLDAPQAELVLTFDGESEPVRIVVGGYADPTTRRLVYLQTDGSDTVAKIRITDAEALLRNPVEFRDRTALSVSADRLESIEVRRAAGDDPATAPAQQVTLTRTNDTWRITAPVESGVDDGPVSQLVSVLAETRALKLHDVADASKLPDFGLDTPQVTLAYSFLPPETYTITPAPAGTNGEAEAPEVTAQQPPAEKRTVRVTRHDDGAVYLLRDEQPEVVYEVAGTVLAALTAEYRNRNLFAFDPDGVTEVKVTADSTTLGFTKTDGQWAFFPEADIPIDETKIANYLLRIKDLKVVRVIDYAATDLSPYELADPAHELALTVDGSALPKLLVSGKTTAAGEPYAMTEGQPIVFVLPPDAVARFTIDVAEFETAP